MEQKAEKFVGPRSIRRHRSARERLVSLCIFGAVSLVSASSANAMPYGEMAFKKCAIVSALSPSNKRYVLDMSRNSQDNGARFHLWEHLDTTNQRFMLLYESAELNGASNWYISVQHSNKCMWSNADRNREPVVQSDCLAMMPWVLDSVGNGNYVIRSGYDRGYVLDVEASRAANGTAVYLYGYHGGTNQKWRLENCRNLRGEFMSPAG